MDRRVQAALHEMVINRGSQANSLHRRVCRSLHGRRGEAATAGRRPVLFDRSLPCNHECQTTEQLTSWLARNRQIAVAANAQPASGLPSALINGISPEDLEALNSYPPGMTETKLRQILNTLNTQ